MGSRFCFETAKENLGEQSEGLNAASKRKQVRHFVKHDCILPLRGQPQPISTGELQGRHFNQPQLSLSLQLDL